MSFSFAKPNALERYRFGFRTADFLLCRSCGVYIDAVMFTGQGSFAALNLNALVPPVQIPTSVPFSYDAETRDTRVTRREEHWTPVVGAA